MKILKSTDGNYVELDLQKTGETGLAIKVSDGIVDEWIAKSRLEDDYEQLDNGLVRIIIPEWLAIDREFI